MNTTDEQFRSDLAEALDASAHDVVPFDTAFLVDAGARRVRHRRLAAGATAAVAVVALAGGGWTLLNQAPQPLVAAPAPSVSPTPTASSPADGSVTISAGDPEQYPADYWDFKIKVVPGSSTPLEFYRVVDGVERLLLTSAEPTPGKSRLFTTPDAPSYVLGVGPADATNVTLLDTGRAAGFSGGDHLVPLGATGWKAFVIHLAQDPGSASDLALMWWRADGTPVSDNGAGHGITIRDRDDSYLVWALPGDNRVGIDGPDGGSSTSPGNSADGRLTILRGGLWMTNQVDNTYGGEYFHAIVVPGSVSKAEATWDDDRIIDERVTTHPWPEMDSTIVVVAATLPPQPGPEPHGGPLGLTGLTWTDAHGVRQEWKV